MEGENVIDAIGKKLGKASDTTSDAMFDVAMAMEISHAMWATADGGPEDTVDYTIVFAAVKRLCGEAHDKLDDVLAQLEELKRYPRGHWDDPSDREIRARFDTSASAVGGRFEPNGGEGARPDRGCAASQGAGSGGNTLRCAVEGVSFSPKALSQMRLLSARMARARKTLRECALAKGFSQGGSHQGGAATT